MIVAALIAVLQPDAGLTLEAVYARNIPGRSRSLIRVDPVERELIEGTLKPTAPWEKRTANGWKFAPAGYVWAQIVSPRNQILQLNASGVSMAYVNGEPRVGDVYGYGTYFIPVSLKKGRNDVLLYGFRGEATLNWRKPGAEVEVDPNDATLPDFNTETNEAQGEWASVVVLNNSAKARTVKVFNPENPQRAAEVWIPPLGVSKVPVQIFNRQKFTAAVGEGKKLWSKREFNLETRKTGEPYRRTFMSRHDSSVQYYAVNPSSKPDPRVMVLSLHGASVEAIGQARAYGQKDFCDIVCPTNRRPFGFNWEHVGRLDALEAFAHAMELGQYDPRRVMLTGHSMGGHGTWHLGAHHPSMFAAISPCAGWISFDTYGGGANYDRNDPMQALLARTNAASDTLRLKQNFADYQSVFIHHGAADETVSVNEARRMRDELKGIAKVDYHEEPGAGHWFDNNPDPGADSVDWKATFEIFRTAKSTRSERIASLRTLDLNIESSFPAGRVIASLKPFEVTRVEGELRDGAWHLTTENVASLMLTRDHDVYLNSKLVSKKGDPYSYTVYKWVNDTWTVGEERPTQRTGFNAVYTNHLTMVLPGRGSNEGRAWAWRKARYDSEQLWYRANATPPIVLASETDAESLDETNVLYYGGAPEQLGIKPKLAHAQLNSPSTAHFAVIQSGAYMAVRIGGSDAKGRRLTERFPLFSPGVGYPDVFAADLSMLSDGSKGIVGAGFFGPDDSVEKGEWVWRD